MKAEPSCSNCKFYRSLGEDRWGECRRYPRRMTEGYNTLDFPGTDRGDWCGEWKFKRAKREQSVIVEEVSTPIETEITWSVKKLQEVDWILTMLHLKGEILGEVVSQSKAKGAIGLDVFDEESWQWMKRIVSEDTWLLLTLCLRFQRIFPNLRMIDRCDEFWQDDPMLCRAIIALCRKDEETLKGFGMVLGQEAPLMQIPEGQVAANVLAPVFRGYWNMRLRLIPGSHYEAHLPTTILGVAVSRLDPLFLLAKGNWLVGRHA